MTHTSELEERAAGKKVRAGVPMQAPAIRSTLSPVTPRAATGRGVFRF